MEAPLLIEDAQSHSAKLAEKKRASSVATPVAVLAALEGIVVVVADGLEVVEGASVRCSIESRPGLVQLVASHHEVLVAQDKV